MSFKLNVVEIRTLRFEVDADNYEDAYVLLKTAISEIDDPAAADHKDIACIDDSGIIQLISPHHTDSVSEIPMLPEAIEVCETIIASPTEDTPKLFVKFYDRRCILFLEQQEQDTSLRIRDISYEPYIEQLEKQDLTDRDVLDQVKNDINIFCSRFGGSDQRINQIMVNDAAEMIFNVIKRTTATGDLASGLSSLFFDGHFVLFIHDKYVNIGLKDIHYDDYINLLEDQNFDEDAILGVIMNDILDFVSQFDGTDHLIDAIKFRKITDIMEIIKFQLFH